VALDREGAPRLFEPEMAWEALDAVVMTGGRYPRDYMSDEMVGMLFAGGTAFAVKGGVPPDTKWPWRREGEWWVLRHEPAGPRSAIAPAAYGPVVAWSPGFSAAVRTRVVLAAVAASILLLATLLLPRRFAWIGIAIVGAGLTAGASVWMRRQPTAAEVSGAVFVRGDGLVQGDEWRFVTARRREHWAGPALPSDVRPIVASSDHAAHLNVALEWDPLRNRARVTADLVPGAKLAVLTRWLTTADQVQWDVRTAETDSPMQSVVRDLYLQPRLKVVGQEPAWGKEYGRWAGVLVEKTQKSER
jgi:hypothetical protein